MLVALEPQQVYTFTGEIKMSKNMPFTVSSFYALLEQKQLMAVKCCECNAVILPPKPMCTNCLSTNLKWVKLPETGKLISYTIIHVAPEQFQSMAPYAVGIVEFDEGLRLPGMIDKNVPENELKVGIELKIGFESSNSSQWPTWGRYFFRPV